VKSKTAFKRFDREELEKLLVEEGFVSCREEALPYLVVMGAIHVGASKRRVAKLLRLKPEERGVFEMYWRNLRRNGVFRGDKVCSPGGFQEEPVLELALLGLVARGLLRRMEEG